MLWPRDLSREDLAIVLAANMRRIQSAEVLRTASAIGVAIEGAKSDLLTEAGVPANEARRLEAEAWFAKQRRR